MKKIMLCALCAAVPVLSAKVATSIPVAEGMNEFRVNTADYYSWNTRTDIYAFKHVKVSEFAHVLKNCISAYGKIQINDKMNMIVITEEPEKLKDILTLCEKLDTPEMDGFEKVQSEVLPVNYSNASDIVPFIRDFLSIEGNAKANDALNYLSVTDHPEVIERIKKEMVKFDIPPKQIEFKFHIVEVYKQNDKEIGTSWGKLFDVVDGQANYSYRFDRDEQTRSSEQYDAQSKGSSLNANVSVNPSALADFIRLMIQKKAINLVADNSILCLNNEASTFTFHYYDKKIMVSMRPVAINEATLKLHARVLSNGETLLENVTLSKIGNSNLLLRLSVDDSRQINRKVPVLGTVLPYLFSKDVKNRNVSSIDIICTPVLPASSQ